MADYLSNKGLDPLKFFGDVAKEVVHQVTGYDFEAHEREKAQKKERRANLDTNLAYNEAISSAVEQQMKHDKESGKIEDDSNSSSGWF